MTAELLKLRYLPTPRWTVAATTAVFAFTMVVAWISGPDDGASALLAGVALPTSIASIVLGVWMAGVEYGQRTIRRALTADPRRLRLVRAKVAVVVAVTIALTSVVSLAAAPLLSAAASVNDASLPVLDTLHQGVAFLINNLVYAVVAFALALLTRSMAGGMALALAFGFVIDPALSAIPSVSDFALGAAMTDITTAVGSDSFSFEETSREAELSRAIPVAAVWFSGLVAAALVRFTRTDVD